jgi:hypothetical protein
MSRIIRNGAIVDDDWQLFTLSDGETPQAVALPAGRRCCRWRFGWRGAKS